MFSSISQPTAVWRQARLPFRLLWLVCLVWLSGCAALSSGPRSVTVSQAQLMQRLVSQFPVQKRYLELFDLQLASPDLRLLPEQNRIETGLAYTLGELWLGTRRVEGQMRLSYGLRFEPSDASVRLTEVRVESFDLSGVSAGLAPQARRLGALVAQTLLEDFALHRFKPEELQKAQQLGLKPGALRVVEGGLQLELLPTQR